MTRPRGPHIPGESELRTWFWRIVKLAVVLAVVGGVVYRVKLAPVPVAAEKITAGELVAEVMGTGTFEARTKATISSKIAGRIHEIRADQGDSVQAGQVLVVLDDRELRREVAVAQAQVDAAEAAIARQQADKERAQAVHALAVKNFERVKQLVAQTAASREDLDKATEELAVAAAELARADAAIMEARKTKVAAERALEYQQARLEEAQIKAPFDGLVIKRTRDPGDVVMPGSSVLSVIALDELWIEAWVDETEMERLQVGQAARVVFRSEPDRSYSGKVARLGKETDRETREFLVDVDVLQLPANWAIGQRAEVYIEVARKENAVRIPAKMLLRLDGVIGTFVAQAGRAVWRPLQLGIRNRDFVEVTSGLKAGDTVVAPRRGSTRLTDGRRIALP